MIKILVVDDERDIRELLVDELTDSGYETIEAANGAEALERVYSDSPDIVLLDLMMPILDGIQVLEILKSNAHTASLPVVLLTAVSADEGEQRAMALGISHYVTKPWEPGTIQTVIKVALREAATGNQTIGAEGSDEQTTTGGGVSEDVETSAFISTGDPQLNIKLGGGVPRQGMTFIEGATSTGKSVLCQHFANAALMNGYGVSYFSSQHSPESLVGQMTSLGMNPSDFYNSNKLSITSIPVAGHFSDCTEALLDLARQVEEMAANFQFVIIDDLAGITNRDQESATISFLNQCKELSSSGKSIVIAGHPGRMSDDVLVRIRSLSDGYLGLRIEKSELKLNKVLEVFKVSKAEFPTGARVNFEVEPGIGIRIDAFTRVKIN